MEILYMQRLDTWCKSNNWTDFGIDINILLNLESKYNITLPIAYKEYQIISGKECPVVKLGRFFEYSEKRQQQAQELLKEFKLSHLIKKPFWVIATDANTFYYFHLDEGDNPRY